MAVIPLTINDGWDINNTLNEIIDIDLIFIEQNNLSMSCGLKERIKNGSTASSAFGDTLQNIRIHILRKLLCI